MGKSQETFNKREREKQRIKKQQDKREKMNERKNSNTQGKDLNSMMAYLDENGNLTDTPPDPRMIKKQVRLEDIQVSVPKQEDRPEDPLRTGVVSFFNDQKGFGFIIDNDTKERIFVHINDISAPLRENDKVTFEVVSGPKGYNAKNVSLIKN